MENMLFNKCQTPLEELELNKYPNEVQETREYTVYRHISPSGKVYVGITKNALKDRWNHGRGYKKCQVFYRAIQKYGWDNIEHHTVCSNLTKNEACLLEQHLVKYYKLKNISYNVADGGIGPTGYKMPETAKKKISAFQAELKGKAVLQYTLHGEFIKEYKSATEAAKILGYGHTSVINCASGIKRENILYGYIFIYKENLDTLPKRLELCKYHWRKHKIVQYKDGIIVNVFDSIREAERQTGISHLCISRNIRGLQQHAGKFMWDKVREEDLYGNEIQ